MKYNMGTEEEQHMPPKSEAQKRAQRRYMANVATIQVRTTAEQKEAIQIHAKDRGESVNGFIQRAIRETMERDRQNRQM